MLLNMLLLSMSISRGCCSSGARWTTRISVVLEDEEEVPQATEISMTPRAIAPNAAMPNVLVPAPNGIHFDNRFTLNSSVCKHKGLLGLLAHRCVIFLRRLLGVHPGGFSSGSKKNAGSDRKFNAKLRCRRVLWALESKGGTFRQSTCEALCHAKWPFIPDRSILRPRGIWT